MLQAEATDAEHLALLRETGVTALLAVPLRAGERILGVLTMGSTQSARRLDDHVLELADALGRRIGEALRNARLYRERDEVAHVLSAGLAPDQALEVAGCEVALRYRPAGEGVEAGGDFYEVIDTPAGPIVVIGDVAGKGAPAAALSAVSRVTLRTAGRLTGDPRAALDELNHALRRRSTLSLCTVAAVALPQELPGLASVVLAGHPPPLLVRDGQVLEVGRPGPLLGAVEAADWRAESFEICPGDTLVLYTDGVLDAALPGGERFGEARLREQVARNGHDPEALIAALDAALAPLRLRDDIAVLAIRCPGAVPLLALDTLDGDAERLLLADAAGRAPGPARGARGAAGRARRAHRAHALLRSPAHRLRAGHQRGAPRRRPDAGGDARGPSRAGGRQGAPGDRRPGARLRPRRPRSPPRRRLWPAPARAARCPLGRRGRLAHHRVGGVRVGAVGRRPARAPAARDRAGRRACAPSRPRQVVADHVGVGAERDAAAQQAPAREPARSGVERQLEHGRDLGLRRRARPGRAR